MFSIRAAREEDCTEIFEQTKLLFEQHENQGAATRLTAEGLRVLQQDQLVQFLVVTTTGEGGVEQVVGYIAYSEETDFHFGGHGITIDQFFIREIHRGKGQGKRLIQGVCTEAQRTGAKYIKLFYQTNSDRQSVYSHLGFTNVTQSPPKVKFFEVYGPAEIQSHFGVDVHKLTEALVRIIPVRPGIDVFKFQPARDSPDGYGQIMLSFALDSEENQHYPSAQMVILIRHSVRLHSLPGLFEVLSLKRALLRRGLSIDETPENIWRGVLQLDEGGFHNWLSRFKLFAQCGRSLPLGKTQQRQ